jgi:hypothetical protein
LGCMCGFDLANAYITVDTLSQQWRCWSCSKFTARYRPGFWRSEAEARRCRRLGRSVAVHIYPC